MIGTSNWFGAIREHHLVPTTYHQKLIFVHTLITIGIEHIKRNPEARLRFWRVHKID